MKKIALSFSSFYLAILLYLMTIDIPIVSFPSCWFHSAIKMGGLVFIGVLISYIELILFSRKANESSKIKRIKPLESSLIPTYIGLFVIMLGFGEMDFKSLLPIILLLFALWCSFERNYYFNIFWSLMGYRFYEAEDMNDNIITLISKSKDTKNTLKFKSFDNLSRINNFTFLEVKK